MNAQKKKKQQLISHFIAMFLGALGGFLGRDLSGLQGPSEQVVDVVVDVVDSKATPSNSATDAGASVTIVPKSK